MSKADVAMERKEQIVRATVKCITKYGYHNFSMQDVAHTAGVSKGIIHYYFLNKDDLMMSVLDRVAHDIEELFVNDMKRYSDPLEKLQAFMTVAFDIVCKTKEYYQVNMDFWTQINQKEEVKAVIAQHYATFRKTCAEVIQEGISAQVFREVHPELYASFILSAIDGLSLQWLFDNKAFDYEIMKQEAKSLLINSLTL